MVFAVINRYLNNDIKPNSLTIIDKYPFVDAADARYFVKNLKQIDRRVISANLVFKD